MGGGGRGGGGSYFQRNNGYRNCCRLLESIWEHGNEMGSWRNLIFFIVSKYEYVVVTGT